EPPASARASEREGDARLRLHPLPQGRQGHQGDHVDLRPRLRSNGRMTDVDRARELARGALLALERNRRRIDDLNVYPVPDGDTGTNLTLTVRAAVEHLDATTARDLATLANELTRAALMGARGNSGVIFSQILRGFAEVVGQAERLDAPTLARAFRGASDAAYRAVRKPVEGTMLTVIREMAEEAEAQADG